MGNILGKLGLIAVVSVVVILVAAIFVPQVRQVWLNIRADTVQVEVPTGPAVRATEPAGVTRAAGDTESNEVTGSAGKTLDLKIVTVLGKDAIPAILTPEIITADEARSQMLPQERVLGVSIDGEHRAYPLNLLSRREIANDTLGGKPIAVTW